MRTRLIKPQLFENEELGVDEADPLHTILFVGLSCLADREGRLKDRPHWIKSKIFPYRSIADPNAMLEWLAGKGFIVRYSVDGQRYIQMPTFLDHQKPHANEIASVIPAFTAVIETSTNGGSASTNGVSTRSCFNSDSYSDSCSESESPIPEAAASRARKACRIPDDFAVSDEMHAWTEKKCPGVDVAIETEKFMNYYTAKAGKDAARLDWEATWRNWMLNSPKYAGTNGDAVSGSKKERQSLSMKVGKQQDADADPAVKCKTCFDVGFVRKWPDESKPLESVKELCPDCSTKK